MGIFDKIKEAAGDVDLPGERLQQAIEESGDYFDEDTDENAATQQAQTLNGDDLLTSVGLGENLPAPDTPGENGAGTNNPAGASRPSLPDQVKDMTLDEPEEI